jgi:hypothetical protein
MLNALQWQYNASDHKYLVTLQILKALRGLETQSLICKTWGKPLFDANKNKTTAYQVLHTFEFVLNRLFARSFQQEKEFPSMRSKNYKLRLI